MATTHESLQAAFAQHRSGKVREAEAIYRQILQVDPNHFETLHLLGLAAYQFGRHAEAEELIVRAIALGGDQAWYHTNLGEVYRAQGKLAEAEKSLRHSLQLDPKQPEALNNLGLVLGALGQTSEAIGSFSQAMKLRETFAEPHNNLAAILQAQGNLDDAIAHYRQAAQKKPDYAEAYNNLGTALKTKGLLDDAANAYRRALDLAPQKSDVHVNLATVFQAQGKPEEAIASLREALRLDPQSALAHANLGIVLHAQHELAEAIVHYRQAVELDPTDADTFNNLGTALKTQTIQDYVKNQCHGGRALAEKNPDSAEAYLHLGEIALDQDFTVAAEAFRQALGANPDHAKALTNLGKIVEDEGRLSQALEYYDRAVRADADYAKAHLYRGDVYKALGRATDALAAYQNALRQQPHNPEAYNALAMLSNDRARPDDAAEFCRKGLEQDPNSAALYNNLGTALGCQGRMTEGLAAARKAVALRPDSQSAFSNLIYGLNRLPDYSPATLFEEHLEWARRHAEPLTALAAAHTNDPSPDRRLRVGYVSPYFRNHAVNFFTEPLIVAHDHRDFEIFCYSDVGTPDDATARVQAAADHWRDVRRKRDQSVAELVRADAIDILVDLTGHIAGSRLLAFARKPAPVQVTYIGYQNTTGMSAMDYRLTDERADPSGVTDKYYTEKLVRLPRAFFCYQPAAEAPALTPLPALSAGRVTFGSFNNFNKVTPEALRAWMQILARVPDSRLLVLTYFSDDTARRLEELAPSHHVDPRRIEICHNRPRDEYYRLVAQADIALDPFPFNGHTTTCDAIWQGVPVVKLEGQMYASRFGSSVLTNVGLDELITHSVDEYVDAAVRLAGDLERLTALREQLRPRMADSPLLDFQGFTRHVEAAYRQMWIDWCTRSQQGSSTQRP
jgi:protein O-GlcNAc transferase